jgi:hypothetical protein
MQPRPLDLPKPVLTLALLVLCAFLPVASHVFAQEGYPAPGEEGMVTPQAIEIVGGQPADVRKRTAKWLVHSSASVYNPTL